MLSKLLKSLVKENVYLECFHLSVVKRRNEAAQRFMDGDTGRLEIRKKKKKKQADDKLKGPGLLQVHINCGITLLFSTLREVKFIVWTTS